MTTNKELFAKITAAQNQIAQLRQQVNDRTILCCECGVFVGETDCPITATSPTMCERCHKSYLAEVDGENEDAEADWYEGDMA